MRLGVDVRLRRRLVFVGLDRAHPERAAGDQDEHDAHRFGHDECRPRPASGSGRFPARSSGGGELPEARGRVLPDRDQPELRPDLEAVVLRALGRSAIDSIVTPLRRVLADRLLLHGLARTRRGPRRARRRAGPSSDPDRRTPSRSATSFAVVSCLNCSAVDSNFQVRRSWIWASRRCDLGIELRHRARRAGLSRDRGRRGRAVCAEQRRPASWRLSIRGRARPSRSRSSGCERSSAIARLGGLAVASV